MVEMEKNIQANKDNLETLRLAKKYGFSDANHCYFME